MRTATLTRPSPGGNDDEGTFGNWLSDSGFKCFTIELPWRNNASDISCIPPGTYTCHWINSPKHGWCFEVMAVPGRTMCEIHSANMAGDVSKGLVSQLEGCIAPGLSISEFPAGVVPAGDVAQNGVTDSKAALNMLEEDIGTDDFELTIQ